MTTFYMDNTFPLTYRQKVEAQKAFIEAIDPDAVCRLASLHNGGKPCHIFKERAHGSFNVCFFVEFIDDESVTDSYHAPSAERTPATDAEAAADADATVNTTADKLRQLYNPGDGEAKEEAKEQRPEPPVKTNESNPIGHAYMIMDYIAGDKMDLVGFLKSEQKKRFHFFGQLIDVFAELVGYEFDEGGSLTLDEAGKPVLGPMQSMHLDGLRMDLGNKGNTWTPTEGWKKRRRAPNSTIILSAADYALFQYHLICKTYLQPSTDTTLKTLQFEEMILHDAKGLIFGAIDYEQNHGPFVLNHTDLRWSNIIVNDDFDILGIVDWEWFAVIPLQFLVPPFWISGEEAQHVGGTKYWMTLYSLKSILDKRQKDNPSSGHVKLNKAWGSLYRQPDSFVVSNLLRHHHEFMAIYKFSVLHEKRKQSPDEFINFYQGLTGDDSPLAKEVERKLKYAQKYVQYLHDNGLFVEGEDSMAKKEGDEEVAAVVAHAATGDRAQRPEFVKVTDQEGRNDEEIVSGSDTDCHGPRLTSVGTSTRATAV